GSDTAGYGSTSSLVFRILDIAHLPPGGVELLKYDCEVLQHITSDHIIPIVETVELEHKLVVVNRDTATIPLREATGGCALAASTAVHIALCVVRALREIHAKSSTYKTLCPDTIFVSRDYAEVR